MQLPSPKIGQFAIPDPFPAKDTTAAGQEQSTNASTPDGSSPKNLDAAPIVVDYILALQSQMSLPFEHRFDYGYWFGPFQEPSNDNLNNEGTFCKRCELMVPSQQTGKVVCTKTGWCLACTAIPPFISGNLLRKVHRHNGINGQGSNASAKSPEQGKYLVKTELAA